MLKMSNFLGQSFEDQIHKCYFKEKSEIFRIISDDMFLTLFLKPTSGSFWEECISHQCSVLTEEIQEEFVKLKV